MGKKTPQHCFNNIMDGLGLTQVRREMLNTHWADTLLAQICESDIVFCFF